MHKDRKDMENKTTEKITLPAAGAVHVKAPTFDGSTHWAMYIRQFEAATCANNWTDKEKCYSCGKCGHLQVEYWKNKMVREGKMCIRDRRKK